MDAERQHAEHRNHARDPTGREAPHARDTPLRDLLRGRFSVRHARRIDSTPQPFLNRPWDLPELRRPPEGSSQIGVTEDQTTVTELRRNSGDCVRRP